MLNLTHFTQRAARSSLLALVFTAALIAGLPVSATAAVYT
jgi:hypothetical protein